MVFNTFEHAHVEEDQRKYHHTTSDIKTGGSIKGDKAQNDGNNKP